MSEFDEEMLVNREEREERLDNAARSQWRTRTADRRIVKLPCLIFDENGRLVR